MANFLFHSRALETACDWSGVVKLHGHSGAGFGIWLDKDPVYFQIFIRIKSNILFMYVYASVYVCMYVCVHLCVQACVHVYVLYACVHACEHVSVHSHATLSGVSTLFPVCLCLIALKVFSFNWMLTVSAKLAGQ